MLSFDEFEGQVQEALQHLYDFAALERQPLAQAFFDQPMPDGPGRGHRLRRLILEAIEELSPPLGLAPTLPEWRPYRILTLRFVEGASIDDVLIDLAISERQFYREQRKAVAGLAALLWDKYTWAVQQRQDTMAGLGADADEEGAHSLHDEVGRFANDMEVLSLRELIEGAVDAVAPLTAAKGVSIVLDTAPRLQPVRLSRTVGRQVFIQLLGMLLGHPATREIQIHLYPEKRRAWVSLALHTASDKPPFTLSEIDVETPRYLIESLGGIWRDQGATSGPLCVEFSLPANPHKVLLYIEDNPAAIKLVQRYLARHTYRVVGAQSGAEAIALAETLRPDVVLLDIMMPGHDGWQILQQLRNNATMEDIPVIMCSVLDQRDLAQTMGASGYLKKPFSQPQLLEVLRSLE